MNLCEYLLDGSFFKLETRDYPFSLLKIIFASTSSLQLLHMPFLEVDAYVSSKLEN